MPTLRLTAGPLSDRMRSYVHFARWCKLHKIDPSDLAGLLTLAHRAFKAGEREANTGKSADRQREQFEAAAKACGFIVVWSGLYPTLRNARGDSTYDIYLPQV